MTSPRAQDYAGGALDPELPGGRLGGRLSLEAERLVLHGNGTRLDLPLAGARMEQGGAGGRLIFFRHAAFPGRVLYASDPSILSDARLARLPGLGEVARSLRRTRLRRRLLTGLAAAALLAGAVLAGLWIKDSAAAALARRVPVEWERRLGQAVLAQLKASGRILEDPLLEKELARLADPLLKRVEGMEFRLHLSRDGALNAFALPGGAVVVNTGLLLAAEKPEEVLGVLAHECAHVTRRHAMQQLIRSLGLYFVLSSLLGDVSGWLAVLLENSSFLLNQKFSRDLEREADEEGWRMLVAARIDPSGLIRFFERLEERQRDSPLKDLDGALNFLSTHPATPERIRGLKARLAAWSGPAFQPVAFDLRAFQQKIRKAA